MIEKLTISIGGNTLCNTQTVKLLGITIDKTILQIFAFLRKANLKHYRKSENTLH